MKIEIDIKEIINKPEFTQTIAEYIAEKFERELFAELQKDYIKVFNKQLMIAVADIAQKWIKEQEWETKTIIEENLREMSKSTIIELLKGKL